MTRIRTAVYALMGLVAGVAGVAIVAPSRSSGMDSRGEVTVQSLRIVDSHGHTTAFLGNVADGRSPAILLYDSTGKVGAALMVDSQTGKVVPIADAASASTR